jgi:hypothetical protein
MADEKKDREKWVDAVARMIELTQQGKLRWAAKPKAKTSSDDDDRTTAVFETEYKGKSLRLYKVRVNSGGLGLFGLVALGQSNEPPKWRNKVVLEFVNTEGLALWTFPEVNALADLLATVQYQAAGVRDFLTEIFEESEALAS